MSSRNAAFTTAALLLALAACNRDRGRPSRAAEAHDAPPPVPPAALTALVGVLENRTIDSLPPGHGKDVLLRACTTCHAATLITQQRKPPAEWAKTVDKMAAWGAPLPAEEKQRLVEYLASLRSDSTSTSSVRGG
jgi:cytochrome c5